MSSFAVATASLAIDSVVTEKWQQVLDLIASLVRVPAALIMRVEPPHIKVFLSSHSAGNPYEEHELAPLASGLYCETVMASRRQLLVPARLALAVGRKREAGRRRLRLRGLWGWRTFGGCGLRCWRL